jgi:hypothetical protein
MKVVFDTKPLAAAIRRQAWRDAICEIYLQVDCVAEQDSEYAGFVREARFGDVTLTDTLLSPSRSGAKAATSPTQTRIAITPG